MYGQIELDKVTRIFRGKPKWYFDDGSQVDEEYLIGENVYPIEQVEPQDKLYYTYSQAELTDLVIDEENKVIKGFHIYTPKPLEDVLEKVYNEKKNEIFERRDQAIYTDMPYDFPSGQGVIQIRNETDLRNIQGNGVDALKDLVAGNTDTVHIFMDQSNTLREMTPQQMADMASAVKAQAQEAYSVSWTYNHQTLKPIYEDDSKTTQQKIDEILALDVTGGW